MPKAPEDNFCFITSHDPGGGGGWHKASGSDCLPLAAPIGLSPLLILTLCGPKRVLLVSTEPLDDLSCLTQGGGGWHKAWGGGGGLWDLGLESPTMASGNQ